MKLKYSIVSQSLFFVAFCIFHFQSCKSPRKEETELNKTAFISFLKKHNADVNSKKIIVIPNVGCSGCISEAEKSFVKNYRQVDTLYIFTAISDLKLFKNSFPEASLKKDNVIVDTNNVLISIGFNSIYPSIVNIDDSKKVIVEPYNN